MLGVKVIFGASQHIEGNIQLALDQIAPEDLVEVKLTGMGTYIITVLIIYKIKI